MLKALFGPPLRQTRGMVASLPELAGLDWPGRIGQCRTSVLFPAAGPNRDRGPDGAA
ncbi:hypothetical protein [Pseudogemmobacter bohemicus]|uniref:hypothetical protein n=1 Tax=Pseudogemmobacter bohemicus TaxID=2250708 RepID=UPI0038CD1A0E